MTISQLLLALLAVMVIMAFIRPSNLEGFGEDFGHRGFPEKITRANPPLTPDETVFGSVGQAQTFPPLTQANRWNADKTKYVQIPNQFGNLWPPATPIQGWQRGIPKCAEGSSVTTQMPKGDMTEATEPSSGWNMPSTWAYPPFKSLKKKSLSYSGYLEQTGGPRHTTPCYPETIDPSGAIDVLRGDIVKCWSEDPLEIQSLTIENGAQLTGVAGRSPAQGPF